MLLRDARYRDCLRQLLAEGTPGASRFKSIVDTQLARGNVYAFQPWYAALMYQLTGKAAYADHAVSRTEAFVASEEALIAANQRAKVAGDSYLEVGQTIGNLALVYDWCHDRLTPEQRTRRHDLLAPRAVRRGNRHLGGRVASSHGGELGGEYTAMRGAFSSGTASALPSAISLRMALTAASPSAS